MRLTIIATAILLTGCATKVDPVQQHYPITQPKPRPAVIEIHDEFTESTTFRVNMDDELVGRGSLMASFTVHNDVIWGSVSAGTQRLQYSPSSVCRSFSLLVDGNPVHLSVTSNSVSMVSGELTYEILDSLASAESVRGKVCGFHEFELTQAAIDKLEKLRQEWDNQADDI